MFRKRKIQGLNSVTFGLQVSLPPVCVHVHMFIFSCACVVQIHVQVHVTSGKSWPGYDIVVHEKSWTNLNA